MIEDKLLKWKFKRGSDDAVALIYEKYADYLLTLAIALLNDVNTAEDIVHDFFVSFASSRETFKLRGSLKGYLAKCVINRTRDRMRSDKRQPENLDRALLMPSAIDGPQAVVICSEQSQITAAAIAQLPVEQREAVVLHIKGAMKFREIAKLQGVSVNTIQGRYRYGLDKLRSILDNEVKK